MSERGPLTLDDIRAFSQRLRERPAERLIAFLEAERLAGFLRQAAVAAWIARHFPGAETTILFRPEPPERRLIADCCGDFARLVTPPEGSGMVAPVDWFDVGVAAPVRCPDESWQSYGLDKPDLMLLPAMLDVEPAQLDGYADTPPTFRLPDTQTAGMDAQLAEREVNRNRWFAALDVGAAGEDIRLRIEETLGGQALVLPETADVALRLAALARARFAVAANALTVALAGAFRTPCVATAEAPPPWHRGDLVADDATNGLDAAVTILHDRTADCTGWRAPAAKAPPPEPGRIDLPLTLAERPVTAR